MPDYSSGATRVITPAFFSRPTSTLVSTSVPRLLRTNATVVGIAAQKQVLTSRLTQMFTVAAPSASRPTVAMTRALTGTVGRNNVTVLAIAASSYTRTFAATAVSGSGGTTTTPRPTVGKLWPRRG